MAPLLCSHPTLLPLGFPRQEKAWDLRRSHAPDEDSSLPSHSCSRGDIIPLGAGKGSSLSGRTQLMLLPPHFPRPSPLPTLPSPLGFPLTAAFCSWCQHRDWPTKPAREWARGCGASLSFPGSSSVGGRGGTEGTGQKMCFSLIGPGR